MTDSNYKDIIHLPHFEPKHHPRMPMWNRAAQFAPFAALTGYDAAIAETGRLTEAWTDIGDMGREELDGQMALLMERLSEHPIVSISYFQPDDRKAGGSYQTVTGVVRRIDEIERFLEMTDGKKIPIDSLTELNFSR